MYKLLMINVAFAAMYFMQLATAANMIVGSPNGSWDESTNLQRWADAQTFTVGNKLVFQYSSSHDVVEVPKLDYDACQTSNAILSDTSGKTTVSLTKPGKRYFICGIPGHCASGMKMEVNVLASSSSSSSPSVSPATAPATGSLAPLGFPSMGPTEGPAAALSPPPSPSSAGRGSAFQPLLVIVIGAMVANYAF